MAIFTEKDWLAINKAIATGARSVQIGDRRVDYRSMDDMMRARNLIGLDLGHITKSQTVLVAHDSGRPPVTAWDNRNSGF